MIIRSKKLFEKQFKKLPKGIRQKALRKIEIFSQNPFDKSLNNHPLHGALKGLRAFSVTGDVRIVFQEVDDYVVVLFIAIGTHSQVYE